MLGLGRYFSFLLLYTVGRTKWMEISPSYGFCLHTGQCKHKKRSQISMSRVRFEPIIPVFERAKTVYVSDHAATAIGAMEGIGNVNNKEAYM
jgi:hypothetical protein